MAGLGSALETAKNTLLTQEILIQTASHNIANADNPAYSRQTASVVTTTPSRVTGGWVGNGTTIAQISQYRDAYVDKQLMTGVSQEADYQTRTSVLSPVASFLQDDGNSGLSASLGAFWDSWDALSQNPAGTSEKQNVVSTAQTLADGIQSAYDELASQGADLKTQISDNVDKVNTILKQIASLNQQIATAEAGGQTANDLRDSRYQAMTKLSGYVGVTYAEATDGTFSVTLTDNGTDYTLVSGVQYGQLQADNTDAGNTADPVIECQSAGGGSFTSLTGPTGGSLSGMLTAWGEAFSTNTTNFPDSYANRLDTFANNLITQVNNAYDGTHTNVVFSGTGAGDISVAATSSNLDSTNAVAVSDLQNTSQSSLSNMTFGEYLANVQHQVGVDLQDASSQADFQKALVTQLQNQQQSASGVNLDEEMVNLIKCQQVYQAAAKIISSTRDMMMTLVNMV